MKRNHRGLFLGALALLLCLSAVCPLYASAEDAIESTAFIFSNLSREDTVYEIRDGHVTLPLQEGAVFRANELSAITAAGQTNALYIQLINRSEATELVVQYRYVLYTPQQAEIRKAILPSSETEQALILAVPNVDTMTELSLSFNAAAGEVVLCSLFNVSVHDRAFEELVNVESCRYDAQTNAVNISGTIGWETAVRYAGSTLALFSIAPDEESYLFNKVPILRAEISSRFSFSFAVAGVEDLFYRYIIAVITPSGERVPLTTPYYPTVAVSAAASDSAFKGFATENAEKIVDMGGQSAVLDVYLDRLQTKQSSGVLYTGDHSYYYFDADYIASIDRYVKNMTGIGCCVYLRFLISPSANDNTFACYTEPEEALYSKGIYIRNEEALLNVYALTDFLTRRYADDTHGKISGIILGRSVNRAALYNRTDEHTLARDSEYYAAAYSLVSGVACRNASDLAIFVPLSDSAVGSSISSAELTGDYPADLYLHSFLSTLKDYYLDPPCINILIESEGDTSGAYSPANRARLQDLILNAHRIFDGTQLTVACLWRPDAGMSEKALQDAYVCQFLQSRTSGFVTKSILDITHLANSEQEEVLRALEYVAQHIDSDHYESALASTLARLGDRAKELGYHPSSYYTRGVYRATMTKGGYGNARPIGSLTIWQFSGATGARNWYPLGTAPQTHLYASNETTYLSAAISSSDEYGGFANAFLHGAELRYAPLLRLDMGILGESGAQYELRVQLIGTSSTVLASTVLLAGEQTSLTVDLSPMAEKISDVHALRLSARRIDGKADAATILLQSVALESETYSAEELKNILNTSQPQDGNGDHTGFFSSALIRPILITTLVVLISIGAAALCILFYKRKKRKAKS